MTSNFENDTEVEARVDQESPKPDFFKIFLSHYNDQELKDLWNFVKDSEFGPHIFLKGLFFEYGVSLAGESNKIAAFQVYRIGAENRDSYCNFRLHFIYKKEFTEFGAQKDRFLEMLHLIKAAAFFDEKDNRINRKYFDPVMHLAVHLDNEDLDLIKCVELLDKYKAMGEKEKKIGDFLHYWCCVRFSLSDHTKNECLNNLGSLADDDDPESCYFLGEAYRYGEEFRQDLELSKKYLEIAKENGCVKAIESLGYLYQLNKQPDKSIQNYQEGAQIGAYTSLKILGEYQIVGKYIAQDFEAGMKNIYYAYLQCDFWALLTMYEIYKYLELKEKKNIEIQGKMFHLAKTLFDIKHKIGKIAHIRLAYSVYAECFEKGYGTRKDVKKAKAILMESLEKIELEKLKTFIYYRLALITERQGEYEDANKYYDSCIRACLMMVEGFNVIKNQAYFYLLGKLLYLGKGTVKNSQKAVEYLREGVKLENFFFFGAIFSKKCQNLLKMIPTNESLVKICAVKSFEKVKDRKPRTASIYDLKDVKMDAYVDTIGPVKVFYGQFKDHPVRLEEYYNTSQKTFIQTLNHLVVLMNIKNPNLDEIIGISADPKTCEVIAIFRPIEFSYVSVEEWNDLERAEKNLPSDRESKFSYQRSQETEEYNLTERASHKIPLNKKIDICLKITDAVQSLHIEKISHGNLIPKNVFISKKNEVIVTGYGYHTPKIYNNDPTFTQGDNISAGEAVRYLAPEALQRIRHIDIKSDIWSLGCLFYLIFYERQPMNNLSVIDILQSYRKKANTELKFTDEIPKPLQDLIAQCVKIDPKERCDTSYIINVLHTVKLKFI